MTERLVLPLVRWTFTEERSIPIEDGEPDRPATLDELLAEAQREWGGRVDLLMFAGQARSGAKVHLCHRTKPAAFGSHRCGHRGCPLCAEPPPDWYVFAECGARNCSPVLGAEVDCLLCLRRVALAVEQRRRTVP